MAVKISSTLLRAIPNPATGTETVLVVEDEDVIRKIASRSLEMAGYKVLVAASGDEALRITAEYSGIIHLLLTDVVMPRMGGRALAQKLVKQRPEVRVLFMSGYADNAFAHHGVIDENTNFIAKPFTGTELGQKVREVLDGDGTVMSARYANKF